MDVVNIGRSRRFLRERPVHVNLFDRPRLVVDLLCLEPEQEESRRGFDRSDSLLVLIEGEARLRAGPQIESLQKMDAVLVPPGQEYQLANTGEGQMTAVVVLTPKPTRADEVRVPGDHRPFRTVRPDPEERDRGRRRASFREDSSPPRSRGGDREEGSARTPRPAGGPVRRGPPPPRGRTPYRGAGAGTEEPAGPRRGSSGARPARRGEGEGPVWYPKPKPAWRPRGAPPAGAGPGRPPVTGRGGPRRTDGGGPDDRPARGPRGGYRRPEGGNAGQDAGRPARPGSNKKTGDARRASRGQGPLSGRRGPGRSGPRT